MLYAKEYDTELKQKLRKSFYVDNVVTSILTKEELKKFITCFNNLMSKNGFDLRGWEYTEEGNDTEHGKKKKKKKKKKKNCCA